MSTRETERMGCGGVISALDYLPFSANPASLGVNPLFPRMQARSAHSLPPLLYSGLNPHRVWLRGAVLIVEAWVNVGGSQHPTERQADNAQDGQPSVIQKPFPADQDRENNPS